jgi:hypothetical protein
MMKNLVLRFDADLSWNSWSAIIIFGCGFIGLVMGVEVSERPGVPGTDLFTKAYYASLCSAAWIWARRQTVPCWGEYCCG